jgi:hypothetical protein
MKKIIIALALCGLFVSCDSIDKKDPQPSDISTLVLNNGDWGKNDSNICIYYPSTKTLTADLFKNGNGQKLGDLGQDILVHGNEIYIAVNGSKTIFVTDLSLKIKSQVNATHDGSPLSPRAFATAGDKVYVTYYEGFVGEINPDNYSVRLTAVGENPDGIAVAGDNLYVANSGGLSYPNYGTTLSVVSISDFVQTGTITVHDNPSILCPTSDGSYVYLMSYGNYADKPSKLQIINTADNSVTDLDYTGPSDIAKDAHNNLYILCGGYDQNWNPLPGKVYRHDMTTNTKLGEFVTDQTAMPDAYSISVARDGYIYVGCSDYVSTGDVYVFNSQGKLHDRFDSMGMNPIVVH